MASWEHPKNAVVQMRWAAAKIQRAEAMGIDEEAAAYSFKKRQEKAACIRLHTVDVGMRIDERQKIEAHDNV